VVVRFKLWKKSSWGRPQWDALRLKISSGVPILQAIDITGRTAGNSVVERAMGEVTDSVKSGGTIAAPLREAKVFPMMVAQMVGAGEETGALDTMLAKVADFYEDEVETAVKGLTSLLEPLMIILVGGIVGFTANQQGPQTEAIPAR